MKMTTHDFLDGLGPVPAHRHPNGRGWVADSAYVDAACFVGPKARVSGVAVVRGKSFIRGHATVLGDSYVENSTVSQYAVVKGHVQNSVVIGSSVFVGDNASVYNAVLRRDVVIHGYAVVTGGTWLDNPTQIQGTQDFVTHSRPGYIRIGCQEHKIRHWLRMYRAIGKSYSYSKKQLDEYRQYIELIARKEGLL